jgi:hypothetical protein
MSTADDRAWLRRRHAAASEGLAELKASVALPSRTAEEKHWDKFFIEASIDMLQFYEKELERLGAKV